MSHYSVGDVTTCGLHEGSTCARSRLYQRGVKRNFHDETVQQVSRLPLEMLEVILVKAIVILYTVNYRTREAKQLAYDVLAGVSSVWWQTVKGWPRSSTRHWLKHKVRQLLEHASHQYPRLLVSLRMQEAVCGVTQLNDKIYVICAGNESIEVFNSRYKRLRSLDVKGLKTPRDITVCRYTRQLFVADYNKNCIWRLTETGATLNAISTVSPWSLSVTSCRLLVTSRDSNKLRLFGTDSKHRMLISLPDYMQPQHAVETSNETFIVSHTSRQSDDLSDHKVSELDANGHVIRSTNHRLNLPCHVALKDDGRVLVADHYNHRVLLLNQLFSLERVLLTKEQHKKHLPCRLCYVPRTGYLLVGWLQPGCVKLFSLH